MLRNFLKLMGGIFVDRDSHDFSFMDKSQAILEKGGVVGIFPESRIPEKDEEKPLEFKPSAAALALAANVPVIPVYTDGVYFKKKRARVIIGKPVYPSELYNSQEDYKTNVENITKALRNNIINLGKTLAKRVDYENKKKNK